MKLSEFDYQLPRELIAQHPLPQRSASRLMHLSGKGAIYDRSFRDLANVLRAGDVLVFNDTRVIKARLSGLKQTGGKCEVLVERVLSKNQMLAQLKANHPPQAGTVLLLDGGIEAKVIRRREEFFELEIDRDVDDVLARRGNVPLPPYIERPVDDLDEQRYQTVYAKHPGAVAAPTAGLHFDEAMLNELNGRGIALAPLTLHVGAGTFQPVRDEDISLHRMHRERFRIPESTVSAIERAKAIGARTIAVGTTSLRALEAAAQSGKLKAAEGETDLFVVPGFRFRIVDLLITNFHLPRSTLLILVSAFGGVENIRRAYRHAIELRYRFFSYGDAMLIERSAF